jgi:hypothetical protein
MYIIHPESPTKITAPLVMDRRGRKDKELDRQTAAKSRKYRGSLYLVSSSANQNQNQNRGM